MVRFFWALILLTPIGGLLIKRNMRLEFDDLFVKFNPKYMDGRYYLQNKSDGSNEMFVHFELKTVQEAPLITTAKIFHLTANGQYVLTIPVASIELCELAGNFGKNPIFAVLITNVRKSGKIPTKCPIRTGSYNLVHFGPQPQLYPVILPAKNFRFDLQVCTGLNNELLFNITTFQSFREL